MAQWSILNILAASNNRDKLLQSPPLMQLDINTPHTAVEWIASRSYSISEDQEVRNSLIEMYEKLYSIKPLELLLKVAALQMRGEGGIHVSLVGDMQRYNPTSSNVGEYTASKKEITISHCINHINSCKRIFIHELTHMVMSEIYGVSQVDSNIARYREAVFDNLVKLADFLEVDKHCYSSAHGLGKYLATMCLSKYERLPPHNCLITWAFDENYSEDQYDQEVLANFVEILTFSYDEDEMEFYAPLNQYWNEVISPALQGYIESHPDAALVI